MFFQYCPTEVDKEYPLDTDTPNNLIDKQSKKSCKAYIHLSLQQEYTVTSHIQNGVICSLKI